MASQQDMFNDTEDFNEVLDVGNDDVDKDEEEENTVEGVVIQDRVPNDYDKKTKKTVAWQEGELSIMIDHMEDHYNLLVGHTKGNEYRKTRVKAWRNLLTGINTWNDQNNTRIVRSVKSIRTKMRNLRQRTKAKLLKWKVHKTGGGPAPTAFNRIEEAIVRLLGDTPEFAGVVADYLGDSRIELKRGPNNNDLQAKVCKAKVVGQTSNLLRAMNTNTTLNVENMTKNLKKSKKSVAKVTAVKPTVTFPDDKTPDDGMSSEEEQAEPIGDIAELTARVSENAVVPSNQAQEPGSSARVRVFGTKKNKGVGKGCSGSSGPPAPKRKPTSTVSRPPPSDSSSNDESSNEEDAVQATQTITDLPKEILVHIFRFLDTDSMRKCTTTAKELYETWLFPEVWEVFESEEEYFDTRVLEILEKHTNKVTQFTAKYKHQYELNQPLNSVLFSMYNLVKLNLAGCEIIFNVDFLQIMYKLQELNLSECPGMSAVSLMRSLPTVGTLKEFICRGNDVRVTAFTIFRSVRDLSGLEVLDVCDSGTMRPWLAKRICWYCSDLTRFYFTTFWSLDTDADKVRWYKLVRRSYPDVEFTERVNNKVDEYMEDCRAVRQEARLDDWEDDAIQHNPI